VIYLKRGEWLCSIGISGDGPRVLYHIHRCIGTSKQHHAGKLDTDIVLSSNCNQEALTYPINLNRKWIENATRGCWLVGGMWCMKSQNEYFFLQGSWHKRSSFLSLVDLIRVRWLPPARRLSPTLLSSRIQKGFQTIYRRNGSHCLLFHVFSNLFGDIKKEIKCRFFRNSNVILSANLNLRRFSGNRISY
jgi:hypothetical protein